MKLQKLMVLCALALSISVSISACSSGGGSSPAPGNKQGNVTPVTVASKVSVVAAQPTQSAGKPSVKALLLGVTSLPAATDYYNDKTFVYVAERTSDAFNTINDILCMMGQTKYDAMLNKGVYTALVDQNVCKSNNSNPSNAGQQTQDQSSSANMPNYMKFTVKSSRADDTSPEYVKVWGHQPASDHDRAAFIFGAGVITEGTSSTNPYGIFTFDFAGYDVDVNGDPANLATPIFRGTLKAFRDATGKVLLDFASDSSNPGCGGTEASQQQVTLDRQPDGSAGAGLIYRNSSGACGSETINFDIAFDTADFWRKDLIAAGNPTACLSRTKFNESSWSYGLYDGTGSRLARNSGFPITYGPSATYHGYVGYWGVWTDNNAPALNNGDTVTKVDYRTSTKTNYTIFKRGGKLHRHDRKNLTLANVTNIPLNYYEQDMSSPTGTNYEVVWDGSNFNKVAEMPQNCGGNCTWANITTLPTPTIDLSHLTNGGNLNFWSQSLGGQAQVPLSGCTWNAPITNYPNGYTSCSTPSNSTAVIFYSDIVVYAGDSTVPATLACFDNCPLATALTSSNPYYGWGTGEHDYTFDANIADANAMLLMEGSNPVVLSSVNPSYNWGIQSGPLFASTPANLALLDCNWDGDNNPTTNPQTCSWKAWSVLPVFYSWETGPDTWHEFLGVMNAAGDLVQFDAPLQVKYVHHQPDNTMPDYKYDGNTFMLDYEGFGQLNGIPSYCVNMDTGAKVDCSLANGSNSIRWVPEFTIPAIQPSNAPNPGDLTEVLADSTTYYVKPLEIEQRMIKDTTVGACSGLATTDFTGYTLPLLSDIFTDPSGNPEPTAPAAPAVIGGVVQ